MSESLTQKALRPCDVAERWQCSEQHIRSLYHTGKLRGFKIGGRLLRFSVDAVIEFEGQPAKANDSLTAYQKWKQGRENKIAARSQG